MAHAARQLNLSVTAWVVYNHLFTFTCCFRGITGALPVRRLGLPSTGEFLKSFLYVLSDINF